MHQRERNLDFETQKHIKTLLTVERILLQNCTKLRQVITISINYQNLAIIANNGDFGLIFDLLSCEHYTFRKYL